MTFLEYVCRELMGKPAYGTMWHCPYHDDSNPSFSVRPPKGLFSVKFKCWGCGEWGDEFDLMQLFFPNENFDERKKRIKAMTKKYEAAGFSTGENYSNNRWVRKMKKHTDAEHHDPGVALLYRMLTKGEICLEDVLEISSDYKYVCELESEQLQYAKAKNGK